jgi:hypothetical protein
MEREKKVRVEKSNNRQVTYKCTSSYSSNFVCQVAKLLHPKRRDVIDMADDVEF